MGWRAVNTEELCSFEMSIMSDYSKCENSSKRGHPPRQKQQISYKLLEKLK
jgi:hypothetical protein